MHEQKLPERDNPAEQILGINAEIYDLRSQLLYERIGEEGMLALADHQEEQKLLEGLAEEQDEETIALSAFFDRVDYDEQSQSMFNQPYADLDERQKQSVGQRVGQIREAKAALGEQNPALLSAFLERTKLDDEVGNTFVADYPGFIYEATQQRPDTFVMTARTPFRQDAETEYFVQVTVERHPGAEAEASERPLIVDKATQRPIDVRGMLEAYSADEKTQIEMWLEGYPVSEESRNRMFPAALTGLGHVKEYLQQQLAHHRSASE